MQANWKQKEISNWRGSLDRFRNQIQTLRCYVRRNVCKRYFSLWDARLGHLDGVGRSEWKLVEGLGLEGILKEEWQAYIGIVYTNFIKLDDNVDDLICWSKNEKSGSFI